MDFQPSTMRRYVTSLPLEILGEEGLVGFIIFILIVYYMVNSSIALHKRKDLTDDERKIFLANLGCWVFSMLISLKQGSLITSDFIFLFAALHERIIVLINNKPRLEKSEKIEKVVNQDDKLINDGVRLR